MNDPNWFKIIQQWRAKKMGAYGITLPFLVGALAHEKGHATATLEDVTALLSEMIEKPVPGYMAVVRWCGDIEAPVISLRAVDDPFKIAIRDGFSPTDGGELSVGFTEDLMSIFNLNCANAQECREKLENYAKCLVENGLFSKNVNLVTGLREYGSFSQRDIDYIQSTLSGHV